MTAFATDEERIFNALMNKEFFQYIEHGQNFIRVRDPKTGNIFELKCKIIKPKAK
jgi:hypothetical protein